MVPLLAKMAVEKKCDFEKVTGGYLSDYEYAYASGKIASILGVSIDPKMPLLEIQKILMDKVKAYTPENARDNVLFKLYPHYVVKNTEDDDIKVLVEMGLSE